MMDTSSSLHREINVSMYKALIGWRKTIAEKSRNQARPHKKLSRD